MEKVARKSDAVENNFEVPERAKYCWRCDGAVDEKGDCKRGCNRVVRMDDAG